MSREILFKAKRLDNSEWIEGDLIHAPDGRAAISTYDGLDEVIPPTVCQYTGLTDRNGVKAFEGDIIQSSGGLYVVMYYNDRAAFMRVEINVNVYVYLSRYSMRNEFEVVGNRWDTPELLEGGTGEDD
ncbi:MAG: YopX family protein [Lachnospiraceae bacterium]|nr:YopX family protein [Lachnospiraceae bacterium]